MNEPETLGMDVRDCKAVHYNDKEDQFHRVGVAGCTRIATYGEVGIRQDIPYVAVYYDGELTNRIPAYMVEIVY